MQPEEALPIKHSKYGCYTSLCLVHDQNQFDQRR